MCCWRSADLKLDSALHSPLGFQSLTNWRSTAPARGGGAKLQPFSLNSELCFNHSPVVQLPLAALPRCQVVSRPRHSVNTPPQTTSDGCSSWAAQVRISAGGVPSSECTASKLCAVCGRNTGRDGTSPQQRQAQAQTRGRGHDGVGARRSCSD